MESLAKIITHKLSGIREKLTSLKDEPKQVSMGYALGIFLAASPFIGFKVPIAIAITLLFKWNKIAAIIGVFHVNPITAPFFYGFSFLIGKTILGINVSFNFSWPVTIQTLFDMLSTNSLVFMSLLAGGIILGLPMAVAAYCISNSLIHRKTSFKPNAI